MNPEHLGQLDGRIRTRLVQLEVILSSVAHQLGATMLPTIKADPELSEHRSWRRLAFQAQALSDHLRNQKLALDFLRGKKAGDLDDMPGEQWQGWVAPLLEGLLTKRQTLQWSGQVPDPVALPLSHAVATAMIAVDEQMRGAAAVHVSLGRDGENESIEIRFDAPLDDLVVATPPVLISAWGHAAATVEVSPGHFRICGKPGS